VRGFGFDAGQKLSRGDDELFFIAGEHERRLAGGERRVAQNFVAVPVKFDVLPDGESAQPEVVGDGFDSFHNTMFISYPSAVKRARKQHKGINAASRMS
jgi:hypothetical protein